MDVAAAPANVRAHDLMRIGDIVAAAAAAPDWVMPSLRRAPWVVVRRAPAPPGTVPVGVRGPTRGQRWATTVPAGSVAEKVTPEQLVDRVTGMRLHTPAAAALIELRARLATVPLPWGPTGSAGFELASGLATLRCDSDLDIVVRASPAAASLARLSRELHDLPARIDAQVDVGFGAVALEELLGGASDVMLRTVTGPVLIPVTQLAGIR